MNNRVKIRRWSWEFPQSLLGAILLPFWKRYEIEKGEYLDQKVHLYNKFPGGISLGYYILIKKSRCGDKYTLRSIQHEHGHGIQSKYLGPLYLFIIGIPSIVHNIIYRIKKKRHIRCNYYDFYTEKSADKLGGVER